MNELISNIIIVTFLIIICLQFYGLSLARKKLNKYAAKMNVMGMKLYRFNEIYWLSDYKFLTVPFKEYVETGKSSMEVVRNKVYANFLVERNKIIAEYASSTTANLLPPSEKPTLQPINS